MSRALGSVPTVQPAQGTSLIAAFQQGRQERSAREAAASKTEREVAIEGQEAELTQTEIEAAQLDNMDAKEKAEIRSLIIGASQ